MDETVNPAVGSPAPGTDQAQEDSPNQAPAANAEQGVGAQADNEGTVTTDRASSEPAVAPAPAATAADAEITMEDVLAASDEQLARKPIHRGMITTGQVIMLANHGYQISQFIQCSFPVCLLKLDQSIQHVGNKVLVQSKV